MSADVNEGVVDAWVVEDFRPGPSGVAVLRANGSDVHTEPIVGWLILSRMVFHSTDYPPKSRPGGMTPTQTTYFDLSFDLHPPPAEEG